MKQLLQGLYVISPEHSVSSNQQSLDLIRQVEAAILGGAQIVQYRDKSRHQARRKREAGQLAALCRRHHVVFIINDDVGLAEAVAADGVHLGGDDMPLAEARQCLPEETLIGVSCYNQIDLALDAQQQGADYVAFGRFFPSRSKPHAVQASADLLKTAKTRLNIPIVAIGGITAQNGAQLVKAGADMLAVIDAVFGGDDVTTAANGLSRLFNCNNIPNSLINP